jgi:hypothetical protein
LYEWWWIEVFLVLHQDYHQFISRPLVSTGKSMQAIAARHNTTSNTMMASIWWQLLSIPTATRGQTTPPILPMAVAIPTPVERTDVGYTYKDKKILARRETVLQKKSTATSFVVRLLQIKTAPTFSKRCSNYFWISVMTFNTLS